MLYFVIAHSMEAQPIIRHFKLQRVYKFGYTMFEAENIKLIICGAGIDNAMMATSVLLGYCIPTSSDMLINIGICASSYDIGTLLLIHKIVHNRHSYFPDILFKHSLKECTLETVGKPQDVAVSERAVDMEAYGVYKAASRFFKTHQMIFLKVVSDNFKPERVTQNEAKTLISSNLTEIQTIINLAANLLKKDDIFLTQELKLIEFASLRLTKSQNNALLDACRYYKLHYKKPLPSMKIKQLATITTKQQRSQYLNELIKTLTR